MSPENVKPIIPFTETLFEFEINALRSLCRKINLWAESKGWNEGEDSVLRKSSDIALMHSELSECLEFVRKRVDPYCGTCGNRSGAINENGEFHCAECGHKTAMKHFSPPDDHVPSLTGESAELADVLIRIFHYCGRRGIDLGTAVALKHEYNLTRPYRHGKAI